MVAQSLVRSKDIAHPAYPLARTISDALDVALAQATGLLLREFGQRRLSAFLPKAASNRHNAPLDLTWREDDG